MATQPTGTVTMLFSDVEGSTELLRRLGAARYADVLEQHNRLLREAFALCSGYEVDTAGDSFFVTFSRAGDAVSAAGEAQRLLATSAWPDGVRVRVRMAIHTGEPLMVEAKYVGLDVHRAARIMSAAHGGQVLVSETTAALLDGIPLRDLGLHRLKDLLAPIRLHQLVLDGLPDDFPPPRSLYRTNLPTAAWPLLGREGELRKIRDLIAHDVRLVMLTGPGGSGKTRLALQAAGELSEGFADGAYFVGLAPLRELAAVRGAVAEAVGLQPDDDVIAWLSPRRTLLVLDNLEHLRGVDSVVADLLVGDTTVIATSRAPLRLSAERELQVEPLPEEAAVELFVSRAAASGRAIPADEAVAAVCRRLDNLPLALELAAARSRLLSPVVLLHRLDAALPLLTGGASDRPERQRTLRATIEWSHELLDSDEQLAFRRLSVFRGSFTLEVAEAVTGVGLDRIGALLDQSLLKPLGDDRFFMLETLREYARERLEEAGETREFGLRHAHHYLSMLEEKHVEAITPDMLPWFDAEEDNLRAMLDRLSVESPADAGRACELLSRYWLSQGANSEVQQRAAVLLAFDELPLRTRVGLLVASYNAAFFLGDFGASGQLAEEALRLAEPGTLDYAWALAGGASSAVHSGDSYTALMYARRAAEAVDSLDDARRWVILIDVGEVLALAGHFDEARAWTSRGRDGLRRAGNEVAAAAATDTLAYLDLADGKFEAARPAFAASIDTARRYEHRTLEALSLRGLGFALLGLEHRAEALATFARLLDLADGFEPSPNADHVAALGGIALSADVSDAAAGARLRGAVMRLRRELTELRLPGVNEVEATFEKSLIDALGSAGWAQQLAAGAELGYDAAMMLARSLRSGPESREAAASFGSGA